MGAARRVHEINGWATHGAGARYAKPAPRRGRRSGPAVCAVAGSRAAAPRRPHTAAQPPRRQARGQGGTQQQRPAQEDRRHRDRAGPQPGARVPARRGARYRAVRRTRRRGRRAADRIRTDWRPIPASRSSRCRGTIWIASRPTGCIRASRCRCRRINYAHPDDLLADANKDSAPALMVALDNISDPRNLGAIVRSVAAFGGHGVLIPQRRSASVTAVAWRTSAGAAARVPVARATNLNRTLKNWADAGLQVVGLDADGDTTVDELDGVGPDGRGGRFRGQGTVAAGAGELRCSGVHPDGRADGVVECLGGRRCGAGRNRATKTSAIAAFDVDPGQPGGNTTMTATYYASDPSGRP